MPRPLVPAGTENFTATVRQQPTLCDGLRQL